MTDRIKLYKKVVELDPIIDTLIDADQVYDNFKKYKELYL